MGPNRPPPNQEVRTEIIEPVLGLNHMQPATNLRPGETPFSQNYVMGDRYIQPRSGATQWGSISATSVPIGFFSGFRMDRTEMAVMLSTTSSAERSGSATNWVPLTVTEPLSSATSAYYSCVVVFDPNSTTASQPHAVVTNADKVPKILGVTSSSLVSLLGFYSIDSYARYVTALDDRVIFFNSGTTMTVGQAGLHATRVAWTSRGSLTGFSNGGFQDLNDMHGTGTGAIAERDRLVLLSDRETWGGNPRRDDFAFDFFALDKGKGCPAANDKTPKNTEAGTIWLGPAFQFYRLIGNDVRALGDKVRSVLETEQREWSLGFSIYNPQDHVYAYFYSDTTGEYPTKALFLRTDTVRPVDTARDDGTWFMQDWGTAFQFSMGGIFGGEMVLFSSTGTPYRLRSTQTNDAGTAIDCRWRSHALRAEKDLFPYEALQEFWTEYDSSSNTTGTLNLHQSGDNGATFTSISNASLTSGINYAFIPVSQPAARNQMFEIRSNDGNQVKLSRFQLKLRGYTGRFSGSA